MRASARHLLCARHLHCLSQAAEMGVPDQIGEEVNFKLEIVPSDLVWQRLVFAMERHHLSQALKGIRPLSGWSRFCFSQSSWQCRGGGPGISLRNQCVVWT